MLQSPIGARGVHPRQEEVARCLEAVSAAAQVSGRVWSLQRRRPRHEGGCQPMQALQSFKDVSSDANTLSLPAQWWCRRQRGSAGTVLMPSELHAVDREGLATLATSHSLPGALKMDEKAAVLTAEDQSYTGHFQALLCLAFLDDRLLFSSSADLSIKVRHRRT